MSQACWKQQEGATTRQNNLIESYSMSGFFVWRNVQERLIPKQVML